MRSFFPSRVSRFLIPFLGGSFPKPDLQTTINTFTNTMDETSLTIDARFAGKNIIITGAGGNFGREGVLFFASRGATVAGLDKNAEALQDTLRFVTAELTKRGKPHEHMCNVFECDVTDPVSVDAAVEGALIFFELRTKRATVNMLWNNAGYQGQIAPTLEYDPKDFATVMSVNVTGMFIVLQSTAKRMAEEAVKMKQEGRVNEAGKFSIVNTASVAGLRGTPAMIAYSSSKAAVLAMTVTASKDLAPHGIRVNAVSPALIGPGYMWTRQNELHAASGSPYFATDPEKVAQNKVNSVPMKRLGSTEEVLKSVAFLLSDDSSYTTGTNLVVDGGMSGGLKA